MDIKQIINFITIVEEGNITKAAQKLHISQPPLRNIQARYAENEKFMRWWRPVSNRIRGAQGRFADRKTHCYFKCPECGQRLRVPKGKGKIMITCPHCHTKFDRKT